MNVIKIIFLSLLLTLSFSSTSSAQQAASYDALASGGKACDAFNALDVDSETTFNTTIKPFICDQDLFINMTNSVYNYRAYEFIDKQLQNLGMSQYQDIKGFSLIDVFAVFFKLVILLPYAITVAFFTLVLWSKVAKGDNVAKEDTLKIFGVRAAKIFIYMTMLLGGFVIIFPLVIIAVSYANAMNANTFSSFSNFTLSNKGLSSAAVMKNDVSAEQLFKIQLARFRTKQALAYVNQSRLASNSILGYFDSTYSKDEVLKMLEKDADYQYKTNLDDTFTVDLSFGNLMFGGAGKIAYDWFTSKEFMTGGAFFKEEQSKLSLKNRLGQPSTIGTIIINNNPNSEIVDPQTASANSQALKDVLSDAAEQSSLGQAAVTSYYKRIYDKILPSIKAGNGEYAYYDWSDIQSELKTKAVAVYNSVEPSIKDISKDGRIRREIANKAFANMISSFMGFDKQNSINNVVDTYIYNGVVDFWNVDCSRFWKEQEQQRKFAGMLQAYDGKWSDEDAADIWSRMTWKCAYIENGSVKTLGFNPESQQEQIQAAYANAKASIAATKIMFSIANAAVKEAAFETAGKDKTNIVAMMRMLRYGFMAVGGQVSKINLADVQYAKMIAELDNAVEISYTYKFEENDNFIDEKSAFGNGTDEEFGSEAEHQIAQINKIYAYPLSAPFFNAQLNIKNGSVAQLKNAQTNGTGGFIEEKVNKIFEDVILGDISAWIKYSLQLNPSLTIAEGLKECDYNYSVCNARTSVSLYQATTSGGQILFVKGMEGIAVVLGLRAVGSLGDMGEGLASLGSIGKKASAIFQGVGGLWKGALAAVVAAGNALMPMFYLMAGVGLTAGYVMPAMLAISPIGFAISSIVFIASVMCLMPLSAFADEFRGGSQYGQKLALRAAFSSANVMIYAISWLLVVAILVSIPAGPIGRFVMDSSTGDSSGIINFIVQILVLCSTLSAIWYITVNITKNLPETVAGWFNIHVGISDSDMMSKAGQYLRSQELVRETVNLAKVPVDILEKELEKRKVSQQNETANKMMQAREQVQEEMNLDLQKPAQTNQTEVKNTENTVTKQNDSEKK